MEWTKLHFYSPFYMFKAWMIIADTDQANGKKDGATY